MRKYKSISLRWLSSVASEKENQKQITRAVRLLLFQSINLQSIFIIKCDKRTQNSAEFSENESAEKHNKTHKHKYTGNDINWNELYSNSLSKLI